MLKRLLIPLALALAWQGTAIAQDSGETQRMGRAYTQLLYDGAAWQLWTHLSKDMQSHFGSITGLGAFIQRMKTHTGRETRVLDELVVPWLGLSIYNRTASFTNARDAVWLQWTLDGAGDVQGMMIRLAELPAASRYLDYKTKTRLRLPFEGRWFVYWGGRSIAQNHHAAAPDQRFAYDFAVARNGHTHEGKGARNESYFCFGRPVLAPGAGTVVAAANGIADNVPGQTNEDQPLGNHVIIDHGGGEHSFMAHLQQGSVRVSSGEAVDPGEVIGRCGNSGRSSEPHLHYHLQTTPDFGDGEGLPAQFEDYEAGGAPIARGEPTRGQFVEPR